MDLSKYINKRTQIILQNGFTYVGLIVDFDEDSVVIFDKTNKKVTLKISSIDFVKELD